jgi:gliding motility-associated protein GldL
MLRKLTHFAESERGKRIKNLVIGVGASVVLIGALFKLMHWPGASQMLIVGMFTEAFLFLLLGILPPHKDYYWEKIYPELDIAPDEEELHKIAAAAPAHGGGGPSAVSQFNNSLANNNLDSESIELLGQHLKKLGENINNLTDMTDAAMSVNKFADKSEEATKALSELKDTYTKAMEAAAAMSNTSVDTIKYQEQVKEVTQNLSQLNAIYEIELRETSTHLKSMNQFVGNLSQAIGNLEESVADTKKYQTEIGTLSRNVSNLNNIYGSMLSAMAMAAKGPNA